MNAPEHRYYDAFLEALLQWQSDEPAIAALLAQPAFAVYRNTVFKGCVDALLANYPAVHRLVGSAWMKSAALAFVQQHLPRQASLIAYGEGFADFLRTLEAAAELPYLPGVATLDRCWTESHLAADDPLLDASALHAALATGRDVTLVPHAASRWHHDRLHPVYTIWNANRRNDGPCELDPDWQGEGVLLTRPQGDVQWHSLGLGGVRFLDACRDGCGIASAADQALAHEPGLDIAQLLGELVLAGTFTSFH